MSAVINNGCPLHTYVWPWVDKAKLTCGQCGLKRKRDSDPDPCIGRLPGVANACCGHGAPKGYVIFENGVMLCGLTREQIARVSGPKAFDAASTNAYAARTGRMPKSRDLIQAKPRHKPKLAPRRRPR